MEPIPSAIPVSLNMEPVPNSVPAPLNGTPVPNAVAPVPNAIDPLPSTAAVPNDVAVHNAAAVPNTAAVPNAVAVPNAAAVPNAVAVPNAIPVDMGPTQANQTHVVSAMPEVYVQSGIEQPQQAVAYSESYPVAQTTVPGYAPQPDNSSLQVRDGSVIISARPPTRSGSRRDSLPVQQNKW